MTVVIISKTASFYLNHLPDQYGCAAEVSWLFIDRHVFVKMLVVRAAMAQWARHCSFTQQTWVEFLLAPVQVTGDVIKAIQP